MADTNCMITTYDNTFNPFTDFIAWYKEDMRLGHDTCGLLARTAEINTFSSDYLKEVAEEEAIDKLVEEYPLIFRKVYASDYSSFS